MFKHQPLAARFQQWKELLDDNLRRRDTAETLHRDDRVDALLLQPAFGLQLLCTTPDDLVDLTQTSLDGVLAQSLVHAQIRLDAIDFRDAGITGFGKQVQPLS